MMEKMIYISIFLSVLISCKKEEIEPQNFDEEIERIAMPYIVSGERVGIAIGTYDNGVKKFYSFGVKHLEHGGIIDENTMFEIGSITKTFTATALAKLHIQGKVSLEDDLQGYFNGTTTIPGYGGDQIKLKHLANHTSSLPREADNMNTDHEETYFQNYTINDFYSFINTYALPRAIGSTAEYSNLGTGILGYVLKESQNKSYHQLINNEILFPLGMQNTVVNFHDANTMNIAQGYVGNVAKPQWIFSEVYEGAGVLKSNMNDMYNFLEAQLINNNDTLHQAIQLTHEKTSVSDISGSDIGLAWVLTTLNDGQHILWHNGGTLSYNSFIGFNKNTGKGVIILMNTANHHYSGEVHFGYEVMRALNKY